MYQKELSITFVWRSVLRDKKAATQQKTMQQTYHIPVMLSECLEGLNLQPNGRYVDVTFGGGGHSHAILQRLSTDGHLYSFDQDPDAIANIRESESFTFIASNFRHIDRFMDYYGQLGQVDGILADLGVSSHHFDTAERGFSFRTDAPLLDMRMNTRSALSARDVINGYDEERLADIIYQYGELRQSRQIASRIVQARTQRSINTIGDLLECIKGTINPKEEKKQLSMLFQALRIEVNDELGALQQMLEASKSVLRPGGRLVVMTYHSLEDRIVKNFLKGTNSDDHLSQIYGSGKPLWRMTTKKPILPTQEEQMANPRSRSAKLRVAEWIGA